MKVRITYLLFLTVGSFTVYNCTVSSHSQIYQDLLQEKLIARESGMAKFMHGDMGGIYPHTLKSNAFTYKIAVMALTAVDTSLHAETLFSKFGFTYPSSVLNWSKAPLSQNKPAGLVFGVIRGRHPIKGKYQIEVANFGCATCHGGALHDRDGLPTNQFVLGIPNTSVNLQAFADELFEGYKILITWSDTRFEQRAHELYPNLSNEELTGLSIVFHGMKKEIQKIAATRGHVAPYKIGSPGNLNGIGAVKMGLGMLDKSHYHENEISQVSIPALADRSFRTSFLVSGNYSPVNREFFYELNQADTSDRHDQEMAPIAALFTTGTMGFNARSAAKAIPDVREVMKFIATLETPAFPASIDEVKAELGRSIFIKQCQSCHGQYEGSNSRNRLVSFPNRLVPIAIIKTDSVRATAITKKDFEKLNKIELGKYFKGRVHKGYVAPILSGIWTTAPYLHNGSVPTLWHLMHPESRPEKFWVGGHSLDYEKVGIRGELSNGAYEFPPGYTSWSDFIVYDTREPGLANRGHDEPFTRLTEQEKELLIEFLKTL